MASRSVVAAVESIVATLHRDYLEGFDCDARLDDALEDHDTEMAAAGQIITDLRRNGLTISKQRSDTGRRKPR